MFSVYVRSLFSCVYVLSCFSEGISDFEAHKGAILLLSPFLSSIKAYTRKHGPPHTILLKVTCGRVAEARKGTRNVPATEASGCASADAHSAIWCGAADAAAAPAAAVGTAGKAT